MPQSTYQPPSSSRIVGIAFVVVLHIAIIYVLITTLAHRSVELGHAPIEAKIIDTAIPPKIDAPPPPPKFVPPPPPFVPPPEVNVAPPTSLASAPTAITTAKPPVASGPVSILPHVDTQHSRQPDYPPQSRAAGEQGSVVLQAFVDIDGKALETKLVQSSGFPRLDQAALDAVKANYRFAPGTLDGKPQPMWYTFKFTWRLR